jgi:hypothetical protein
VETQQRVPRLVPGVDVRVLPLAPIDGFVLSRIDGTATVPELAEVTCAEETRNIVLRLIDLGAAEWSEVSTPRAARAPRPSIPRMPLQTPARGIVRTAPPPPGMTRTLYDPAELDEDIELDIDRKRTILDSFYRLEDLTFYELLGVRRARKRGSGRILRPLQAVHGHALPQAARLLQGDRRSANRLTEPAVLKRTAAG